MAIIEVERLWHIYPGNICALRGVDLQIEEGSIVAIIGQNGSGKTTLVKHFNGLLRPTRGRVLVEGEDISTKTVSQLSRTVGYVFQNPRHQLFCTSVEAEVAFGPRNIGLSEEEVKDRVTDALEFFGISKYRNEHPYSLSMGLRKLVAIASVYSMHPRVMVLDEPTTGLDHIGVDRISIAVEQMSKKGCTIVIITHHMPFVAENAERVVVMAQGEIIADETPRKVFSNMNDVLKKTNLSPPQITELACRLSEFRFPREILTPREMCEALAGRLIK